MFATEGTRVRNIRPNTGDCFVGVVTGPGPGVDDRPDTFVQWDDNGETLWIHDEYLELEQAFTNEDVKAWMNFLVQVTTHKLRFKPTPLAEQDFTAVELRVLRNIMLTALDRLEENGYRTWYGSYAVTAEKIAAKLGVADPKGEVDCAIGFPQASTETIRTPLYYK